ncbi:sulfotransferase 4A1-like [Aricia agestis]|uniref:sulfotransferase 4A1-like n=1 Tax=Aricia agestis TaxID=91739 RepID=UPI001C20A7EC|nr:sulfotransferase 4A1-like [Aricia agestis]
MAKKIQFPYEIKQLTPAEDELAKKYYKDYTRPFLRIGPSGYFGMAGLGDHIQDIYNMEVRPDDVWVTSFSRSGTTWLQELVWLVANDLDFDRAVKEPRSVRYNYIEYPTQIAEVKRDEPPRAGGRKATENDFRDAHALPSPRFIKSHLPLCHLPPQLLDTAKVFYIARDPRDVAVSFFFMHKMFRYFDEGVQFTDFWQLFKKDLLLHTPIFAHIEEAWQRRNHPNLMFLFYEEMQNDLLGVIDRVCKFLNKDYSQEQKMKLAEHLSFDSMASRDTNKAQNTELKFYRKGKAGKWMEYFDTPELVRDANDYVDKHLMNTDLRFPTVE